MTDNEHRQEAASDVGRFEQVIRELVRHLLSDSEEEMRMHIESLSPSEAAYVIAELYARIGEKKPDALDRLRRWLRLFAACEASAARRYESSTPLHPRRKPPA